MWLQSNMKVGLWCYPRCLMWIVVAEFVAFVVAMSCASCSQTMGGALSVNMVSLHYGGMRREFKHQ